MSANFIIQKFCKFAQLALYVRFSRNRNVEKIERKYETHNPDQSVFCYICSFWFDIFHPDLFFMEKLWDLPRNKYWEEIIRWKNVLVEALFCTWNSHVHPILLAQQILSGLCLQFFLYLWIFNCVCQHKVPRHCKIWFGWYQHCATIQKDWSILTLTYFLNIWLRLCYFLTFCNRCNSNKSIEIKKLWF